ncbi:RNA polymerase factor sigma-54 [Oceanobacillus jeddahense]|uniref:RNA polymerase factor sigma-54 n=1 Tax=Oceanobacillus jeddahense TaxID=1462527 RepID=UPI0036250475
MISIQNTVNNEINISLNHYIVNSIQLFKYNQYELYNYIKNKFNENPLVFIYEDKIPISNISQQQVDSHHIIDDILSHFRCTLHTQDQLTMEFILHSLNSKGFLEEQPYEIASYTGSSLNIVEELINQLQSYENKGIGTFNMLDFLKFQLKNKGFYNEKLFTLFSSHLNEINQHSFRFLEDSNVNEVEFKEYIDLITTHCNLTPLEADETLNISPDASIVHGENGLQVIIHDYLSGDISYEPLLTDGHHHSFNAKLEKFKTEYDELISILNARKIYLTQVISIIANVQYDYLTGKSDYLHALDQTDLTEHTKLSPATISRLLSNKYIATPRGTIPIKKLLSKKYHKNLSVSYIKYLIQNITDFEALSDNKISKYLAEIGISISRRTVNKYKNQILGNNKRTSPKP